MTSPPHRWIMRAGFVWLALMIIFFRLLPLETVPRQWAPPDMITAFAFAWVLRRPDYLPTALIGAVMLMADFLLQRPPGLYAALVVMGCHFLKTRTSGMSEASFVGEWTTVAIVLAAIGFVYRLVLTVLVVDQAPVSLSVIDLVLTIAVYPLAVVISQSLFGVRKPGPGDADSLGART